MGVILTPMVVLSKDSLGCDRGIRFALRNNSGVAKKLLSAWRKRWIVEHVV